MRIKLPTCSLRPLTEGDVPSLARHANNRKIWLNLRDTFPHPYSEDDAREFINRINVQSGPPVLAIEIENLAVGTVGVRLRDDVETGTAEIGYWLGEDYWGRGIATEATQAMVQYALEKFQLRRIDAWVYAWNPASARVLQKCGFVHEGTARRNAIKDGHILDEWLYGYAPEV